MIFGVELAEYEKLVAERDRLRAINAELLEALKNAVELVPDLNKPYLYAAIAKAEC